MFYGQRQLIRWTGRITRLYVAECSCYLVIQTKMLQFCIQISLKFSKNEMLTMNGVCSIYIESGLECSFDADYRMYILRKKMRHFRRKLFICVQRCACRQIHTKFVWAKTFSLNLLVIHSHSDGFRECSCAATLYMCLFDIIVVGADIVN